MVVWITLVLVIVVVVDGMVVAVLPTIRAPYGVTFNLRASRRSRRCCITKRNWSNLVLVLLFSISMLVHLTQIGFNGAEVVCDVESGEDVALLAIESTVNDVSLILIDCDVDVGVTGAELAKRIWHR